MNDPSFFWLFGLFILPFAWTPGRSMSPWPPQVPPEGFGHPATDPRDQHRFFLQAMGVGLGLEALFVLYPLSYQILRFVGAAYILYLAYKMTRHSPFTIRR